MATLYIQEYQTSGWTTANGLPCGQEPALASQTVAIGAGSVKSAAFNAATRFVRLHTDSICSVAFGSTTGGGPSATSASMRLAANQTEYFGVVAGQQLAVIQNV